MKNNVLIYAGVHPYACASFMDMLSQRENIGGNLGNCMFIYAVAESIDIKHDINFIPTYYRSSFSDKEIDWINSECSYFILPLADAFREDNMPALKALADTIKKIKIPCIVTGVGLRAPYEYQGDESFSFDEHVKSFMKSVLEKSSIVGLRGENTARYLMGLGFAEGRDFEVIGCPSMCMCPRYEERSEIKLSSSARIGVNANDLAHEYVNSFFQNILREYKNSEVIQQRETEVIDLFLSKYSTYGKDLFRVDGTLYGSDLYNTLKNERRIEAFSNIYDWIQYSKGFDLFVSNRFHGTVASLYAGTPSVVIPIDSRMSELVGYHKLPSIKMEQLRENDNLEEIILGVDFTSFERVKKVNQQRYFAFLEKNGLNHVSSSEIANIGTDDENFSIKYFDDLSFWGKLSRVAEYYFGRVRVKIKKSNGQVWKY